MSNILDITHQHGVEMNRLGLKHSLEMARLYRDNGYTLDDLIKHLEEKMAREAIEHSRFNEEHRKTCDSCRDAYEDFLRDQEIDNQE